MTPQEVAELRRYLTPAELKELDALIDADLADVIWRPLPGPQSMAYESEADIIGFGGAAGGGKTDLAVGKALTQHTVVQMFRREGTELNGIIDRMEEVVGHRDGLGGRPPVWRTPWADKGPRLIEFGSVPNLGDERKFQGRPKDLLVIDEAANFLESQVRFLMGWVRSTIPGQKQQTLMTFNPPTNAEGRWVVDFFGPWLDDRHPLYPTEPGALRWCAVVNGKDRWTDDEGKPLTGRQFVVQGGRIVFDFDPARYAPTEVITPKSRTFIPSRVSDNPYLMGTNYMSTLQALPEPLRSQMLNGDFKAGMEDDPWQVIPTAWVDAAMARWKARSPKGEMLGLGVDVARGGKDNTVIAPRHKVDECPWWFDELQLHPGTETPDGPKVAGLTIAARRHDAPVMIDVIGVGASPYDVLNGMGVQVLGVNVAIKSMATDRSGKLRFFNLRSELWWKFRELLDPANDTGAALPPDNALRRELCAPRWELSGMTIKVESREDIVERIGVSPDRASAVILAAMDVPKVAALRIASARDDVVAYDPIAHMHTLNYDPMGGMR